MVADTVRPIVGPLGRSRTMAVGLGALAAVAASACASTGQFPTVNELGALAAERPADRITPDDVADVDRWQLAGPLPASVATPAHAPAGPWDGMLAQVISASAGLAFASESAACAAREPGLFYVANRALPGEAL